MDASVFCPTYRKLIKEAKFVQGSRFGWRYAEDCTVAKVKLFFFLLFFSIFATNTQVGFVVKRRTVIKKEANLHCKVQVICDVMGLFFLKGPLKPC